MRNPFTVTQDAVVAQDLSQHGRSSWRWLQMAWIKVSDCLKTCLWNLTQRTPKTWQVTISLRYKNNNVSQLKDNL